MQLDAVPGFDVREVGEGTVWLGLFSHAQQTSPRATLNFEKEKNTAPEQGYKELKWGYFSFLHKKYINDIFVFDSLDKLNRLRRSMMFPRVIFNFRIVLLFIAILFKNRSK
jgi:hypothetical protein